MQLWYLFQDFMYVQTATLTPVSSLRISDFFVVHNQSCQLPAKASGDVASFQKDYESLLVVRTLISVVMCPFQLPNWTCTCQVAGLLTEKFHTWPSRRSGGREGRQRKRVFLLLPIMVLQYPMHSADFLQKCHTDSYNTGL